MSSSLRIASIDQFRGFAILAMVLANYLPGVPRWYPEAPVWLVATQATALIAVLSLAAWRLHRKRWTFSL